MSDSKKKYEESHIFWEEQDVTVGSRRVHMTTYVAVSIINRALIEVKDADLGEDLEALKEWINQNKKQ